MSVKSLAERYGIHRATVFSHLRRRNVPSRRPGLCLDEKAEAVRLARAGVSMRAISRRMGVDRKAVRVALVEAGLVVDGWVGRGAASGQRHEARMAGEDVGVAAEHRLEHRVPLGGEGVRHRHLGAQAFDHGVQHGLSTWQVVVQGRGVQPDLAAEPAHGERVGALGVHQGERGLDDRLPGVLGA
ncbi:MAG: hypothetical protein QM286_04780 [Acidobacteriota bacterium]|nr:hypothetical protein [Acidobacteriota bacterium]